MNQPNIKNIEFKKAVPDDFYHVITADAITGRHLRVHEKYQHSVYATAEIIPKKNIFPFRYKITIIFQNEENFGTQYIFFSDKLTKATEDTLKKIKQYLIGSKVVNLGIQIGKPIKTLQQ